MVLLCGNPKTSLLGCEPFCSYLLSCRVLFSAVQFGLVLKRHYSKKTQERDLFSAWSPRWFLPKKERTVWTKSRNYCLDKVTWRVNRSSGWVSVPPAQRAERPLVFPAQWNPLGMTGAGQDSWLHSVPQKEWSSTKLNRELIDWASSVKHTLCV